MFKHYFVCFSHGSFKPITKSYECPAPSCKENTHTRISISGSPCICVLSSRHKYLYST